MDTVLNRDSKSAVHRPAGRPADPAGLRARDWNLALLEEVLPPRASDGEPTVIDCDEVAIRGAAGKLGVGSDRAVALFLQHVDRTWGLRARGLERARAWIEHGSRGGQSGEPPHHLGLLCLLTYVASSMRADEGGSVSNYYGRLNELLGTGQRPLRDVAAVRSLLEELDEWLFEDQEGTRGLLRIPDRVRPAHVGLLQRQVVFRECDVAPLRLGLDASDDDRAVLELARDGRIDGLSRVCLDVLRDAEVEPTVLDAIRDARARTSRHEVRPRSRDRARLSVVLVDDAWEPAFELCAPGSTRRTAVSIGDLLAGLSTRGWELGDRWLAPTETLVFAAEDGGAWTTDGRGDTAVVITTDPGMVEQLSTAANEDEVLTDECPGGWTAFRDVPRHVVGDRPGAHLRRTLPVSIGGGLRLARDRWLARSHGPLVTGPDGDAVDLELLRAADRRVVARGTAGGGCAVDLSDVDGGEYRLADADGAFQERPLCLVEQGTLDPAAASGAAADEPVPVRATLPVLGRRVLVLDKSCRSRAVVAPPSFDLATEIGVGQPETWELELQQYDCWVIGEGRVWCTNPQALKWLKGDAARAVADLEDEYEVVRTAGGPREDVVRRLVGSMQARARKALR